MSILIEIIGYTGTILCISAYILNVQGRLSSDSCYYLLANVFGGAFLVINSVWHWALPSAIENAIWAMVAFISILKRQGKRKAEKHLC